MNTPSAKVLARFSGQVVNAYHENPVWPIAIVGVALGAIVGKCIEPYAPAIGDAMIQGLGFAVSHTLEPQLVPDLSPLVSLNQ